MGMLSVEESKDIYLGHPFSSFIPPMRRVQEHWKWLFLIILVKGGIFTFFAFQFQKHWPEDRLKGGVFVVAGETVTFYAPLENLAAGKGYSWKKEKNEKGELVPKPSTRRMPGLLPIYFPLHLLMGEVPAKVAIIGLQFLLGCIAIYILSLLAYRLFRSISLFFLVLALTLLETYYSIYHHIGLAESFATSFLILTTFFFYRALKGRKPYRDLAVCGLLLAWAVFLRPPVGLILPTFGLVLLVRTIRNNESIGGLLKKGALLSLPLLLFISIWTGRNYAVKGRFIPMEDSVFRSVPELYTPQLKALRGLIRAWGGDRKLWRPRSEASWFASSKAPPAEEFFPERYLTEEYGLDSLRRLRTYFQRADAEHLSSSERKKAQKKAIALARAFQKDFRAEKPFQYYILAPLKAFGRLLYIEHLRLPFPAFENMGIHHKLLKGGYLLAANAIVFFGTFGMLLFMIRCRKEEFALFPLFPLSYMLIISIFLFNVEARYLVPLYPFFILFASYLLLLIGQKAIGRQLLEEPSSK